MLVHRVIPPQEQDFAFPSAELHETSVCLFLQALFFYLFAYLFCQQGCCAIHQQVHAFLTLPFVANMPMNRHLKSRSLSRLISSLLTYVYWYVCF